MGRTSLVRLLESSLSCHSAPRGTVSLLFDCSTPHSALLDSTPFGTPFGSTRLDLAGLSDVCILLYCSAARLYSTRPARIPILSVAFGRHALHTHSVPRVVSRHSVITHLLFHSCSHRRCCLVWSSVIPWVPLVPLVPLVLLRGASLLPVYRLLSSQSLFSIAMQCTGAFNRWVLCRSLVLLESFWSPSGVLLELFERRSGS